MPQRNRGHACLADSRYADRMAADLSPRDALLVVDVQRDFCAGGALAVPAGDEVVPALNAWLGRAAPARSAIVVTRDWHPPDHCSFAARGGPWPEHCVQRSEGARLHPELRIPDGAILVSKGTEPDREAYSGFHGTRLADRLRRGGVERLFVGGLALDYCVRATVLDGLAEGFDVHLILAATRAVEVTAGDAARALAEMRRAGAAVLEEPAT